MGAAIKALHIPIGEVWSEPDIFAALETARLAALPTSEDRQLSWGTMGKAMQAMAKVNPPWT